ncbi:MAG: hypothetical protein Kow006_00630 [Gammaproteobacteria bacterium]
MSESRDQRLPVVLCWHMHQPYYADLLSGEYQLPWVYLHAVKDYVDMAAHLEANPEARAVVNFAPILLEQIDDYVGQLEGWFNEGAGLRDPLLETLASARWPEGVDARLRLIRSLLRANRERMVARFKPFLRLVELAERVLAEPTDALYLGRQFLIDLSVWYHLAWLGETVRRGDTRVRALLDRSCNFTEADRHGLLALIHELMRDLLPRYRRLAESGRVELSVTPYAHPILPLLIDMECAREAQPDAPLPVNRPYPGGVERARWHIERGLESFEAHFGFRPEGCWPAEGGVSDAMLGLLSEAGFRWCATGENVLRHSLDRLHLATGESEKPWLYQPYRLNAPGLTGFFRDDGLSDLVGFTYAEWHGDDAVANLVHHLENIAAASQPAPDRVVSIVLDGENAWEYYPENGYHFLGALYRELSRHPRLKLTTFRDHLANVSPVHELPQLVAGSWVYGTFSTWIGDADKNRGWEMLIEAKRAFDEAVANGRLDGERLRKAERQLAICEGSDWFWWFGDYNPEESVADFERLFRHQLTALYRTLEVPAPDYLDRVFTHGRGTPAAGGVMRANA